MTPDPFWFVAAVAWLFCLAVWLPEAAWDRFRETLPGRIFGRAWEALAFDLPDRIRRHR